MVRRSSSVTPGAAAGGGCEQEGCVRLAGRADGDPAHLARPDIATDLKLQGVAEEGQGGLWVLVREEARVNADVHGVRASRCPLTRASRFLTGPLTGFATTRTCPAGLD